ncbi:hypothetical protein ACHQM5_023367 [Ranunculus cassubicifolius]
MSNSQGMGPQFYKIVHESLNTTHQLRIPPDFVKHVSEEKRGTAAVLKGPRGDCWRVKFSETEEGTFLQDGWKEFTKYHSLGDFEVLIFRYDGDMTFHVEIFDKTACKKEYAFDVEYHEESLNSPDRKETEVPGESIPLVRRSRGRPSKRKADFPKITGRMPSRSSPTEYQLKRVLSTAMSFKSKHPFFIRPLSKSCVYTSFVLCLPAEFAKKHLPKHETEVVLKNDKDQAWRVKYKYGKMGSFCGGWSAFVRDNQLEEGDICIFELLAKLEMRVHIFRCQIN